MTGKSFDNELIVRVAIIYNSREQKSKNGIPWECVNVAAINLKRVGIKMFFFYVIHNKIKCSREFAIVFSASPCRFMWKVYVKYRLRCRGYCFIKIFFQFDISDNAIDFLRTVEGKMWLIECTLFILNNVAEKPFFIGCFKFYSTGWLTTFKLTF